MTTKKGLRMTETCSVDGNVRINHGVCMTNQGMYDQSSPEFWSSKNWEKMSKMKVRMGTRMLEHPPFEWLKNPPASISEGFNALPGLLDYPGRQNAPGSAQNVSHMSWLKKPKQKWNFLAGLRQTLSGSVRQMLSFPKRKCWFHTEPDMGRDLPVLGRPSCLWLGRPNHPPKIEGFPVFPLGIGTGHKTKHFFPYWHGHKFEVKSPIFRGTAMNPWFIHHEKISTFVDTFWCFNHQMELSGQIGHKASPKSSSLKKDFPSKNQPSTSGR